MSAIRQEYASTNVEIHGVLMCVHATLATKWPLMAGLVKVGIWIHMNCSNPSEIKP